MLEKDNNLDPDDLETIEFVQIPQYKETTKSVFKLDPKSDRYRVCPQCGKGHMVRHRSRDFCSDKCCDDYNNQNKRLLKHTQIQIPTPEEPVINTIRFTETAKPQSHQSHGEALTDLQKNTIILDKLKIDLKEGSCFYLRDIIKLGLNFNACSSERLYNMPPGHQANCLISGNYRIYLLDNEMILIAKTI